MLTVYIALLTTASNVQPFLAQSPPAWNVNMPPTPQQVISPLDQAMQAQINTLPPSNISQPARLSLALPSGESPEKDTYVSKIGILASSMPYYHNQYMERIQADKMKKAQAQASHSDGEPLEPHEAAYFQNLSIDTSPREQSSEEQAETARRLKPHSRSTLQIQYITSQAPQKPDESKQNVPKKQPRTKWQFGIRSRNLPHEAIHCVYKALKAQNAQWEVPKPPNTPPLQDPKRYSGNSISHGSEDEEAGSDLRLTRHHRYDLKSPI